MGLTFCIFLTVFQLARDAVAGEQTVRLTNDDARGVKQTLEAFDKGKITLEEATERGRGWGGKLIAYYVLHTNEITVRMKLPISRCYAAANRFTEAAQLATDYINVYSNEWRGWDILGGAKFMTGAYDEALWAMTNAVRLGDKRNYWTLGAAALQTGRLDVFREMVPRFLAFKDAKETPKDEKLDIIGILLAYALKADEKEVFIKAVDGVSADEIIGRDDLKGLVEKGCEQFTAKETKALCDKIAEAKGIESRTNR